MEGLKAILERVFEALSVLDVHRPKNNDLNTSNKFKEFETRVKSLNFEATRNFDVGDFRGVLKSASSALKAYAAHLRFSSGSPLYPAVIGETADVLLSLRTIEEDEDAAEKLATLRRRCRKAPKSDVNVIDNFKKESNLLNAIDALAEKKRLEKRSMRRNYFSDIDVSIIIDDVVRETAEDLIRDVAAEILDVDSQKRILQNLFDGEF